MNNQDILNKPLHILNNTKIIKSKPKYINLNDIKKQKIKKDIIEYPNLSKRDIMIKNGYAKTTASHKASSNKLLNEAMVEVSEELRAEGIDKDWLLHQWTQGLTAAFKDRDYSTYNSILANIAKYVAQISEKSEVTSKDIKISYGFNPLREKETILNVVSAGEGKGNGNIST